MVGENRSLARNDYGALQNIAQLTNVSGPGIIQELGEGFGTEIRHPAIVTLIHKAD